MSLVAWSPFREFDDLFNRYGRVAGARWPEGDDSGAREASWRPSANIAETEAAYIIRAELPEVKKDDVDVSVHDGVITIKGERRYEKVDDSERQHRIESRYGSFARSFSLPADVDEAAISAESKDGVLTVRLPKREDEKPKSIQIAVN